MATDQELEEIRRRSDIVDLISHHVTLKKAGANYKALCPFHEERTGSFMVSPEKQIYKCFGCGEGGDIFGFIMKLEGLTFPEAVQFLADRTGVKLTKQTMDHSSAKKDDKNHLFAINDFAAKYFQTILTKHPAGAKAKEYLHGRGLTDATIQDFRLGFAPSQRGLADLLLKKGYSDAEIAAAGKPDRFFNRIMFPICDPMGNVIAFTGREFPDNTGPKYLNTAETILFHKSSALYGLEHAKMAIRQKQAIIFVEGQMDVLSSAQVGVKHVVASSGTAFTLDHLKHLYRYAQRYVLAFDNDDAGQKATEKVFQMCLQNDFIVDVVQFPSEFKDVGEILEKNPALWQKLVDRAIPAVQWYFNRVFASFGNADTLNGTQKEKISSLLSPIIKQIKDPIERYHYEQKLAKQLDSVAKNLDNMQALVHQKEAGADRKTDAKISFQNNQTVPEKLTLEEGILHHFIFHPELARDFLSELEQKYFPSSYQPIVKEVKIWYNNNENKKSDNTSVVVYLQQRLPESDRLVLEKIINNSLRPSNELTSPSTEPDVIRSELAQSLEHLYKNFHEAEKSRFAEAIASAEESGDRAKVKALLGELQTYLQNPGGNHGQKDN